jgi:hypothetical protein
MNRAWVVSLVLIFALATLAGCKPEWWPDKGAAGIEWPPPKPEQWQGDWPPDNDDPNWWTKHFRDRNDGGGEGNTHDPEHVSENGFAGYQKFSQAFQWIEDPARSDCGLFRLDRIERQDVDSCVPFPQQMVQQFCATVRDANAAETECQRQCGMRDRCTVARIFRPEMNVFWQCKLRLPDTQNEARCQAAFLCECLEG